MRPGRRTLLIWAVALVLTACGSTADVHTSRADSIDGSIQPTGTDAATVDGSIEWGPCDDPNAEDPALQCATLTVPLDYDNPTGDSIDLALIRFPATGDRKGVVLLNPGGPGGSGFDPVAFSGAAIASGLGIESLDLIGFDPRGVDRSDGIRCVTDEFQDQHLYIDTTPDTPEEQQLKDEAQTGFTAGCKQQYGDTLRFYSTANTARDMDAIRAALEIGRASCRERV